MNQWGLVLSLYAVLLSLPLPIDQPIHSSSVRLRPSLPIATQILLLCLTRINTITLARRAHGELSAQHHNIYEGGGRWGNREYIRAFRYYTRRNFGSIRFIVPEETCRVASVYLPGAMT